MRIVRRLGWAAALALLWAPSASLGFDLTGTWEVSAQTCKGFASSTSAPEPFRQKRDPGATTLEITQTGGDLNLSFTRVFLGGVNLYDGWAFDERKNSTGLAIRPDRSVGGFTACGGIPEDLMGASARTELATIESAKLSGSGKAKMKLTVKAVQFGFETGMSPVTNWSWDCRYTLLRVDDTDRGVPACP